VHEEIKQGEEFKFLRVYPENPAFRPKEVLKHLARESIFGLAMTEGKTFFSRNIHHDPRIICKE
jgi:hypothetical protein